MRNLLFLVFLLICFSCVEPYDFEAVDSVDVLVVDASLTNEHSSHYVLLSKSIGLKDSVHMPVSGATVWVENEDDGTQISFLESDPGVYLTDASIAGRIGSRYTLHINDSEGNSYKSTPELLLPSTPIDSVYGKFKVFPSSETGVNSRGVQFFVDAHKSMLESAYYRYEFEQDYAIRVPYISRYKWIEDEQTFIERDTLIYLCYRKIPPSGILITTTSGQSENVVSGFPLTMVEETDPYLLTKYSLIVKQYSVSSGAYQYYKSLKELNEASGSFFDKQKGAVVGNIENVTSPSIPVLGYFEVAGVSTISEVFNPAKWDKEGYNPVQVFFKDCSYDFVVDTVSVADLDSGLVDMYTKNIYHLSMDGQSAYLVPETCSDCRLYGKLTKPDFWE